jgi:hypothetical protein
MATVVVLALGAALPARAQQGDPASLGGVRAADQRVEALLAAGSAHSRTFRDIVEELQRSDVIVYVDLRPLALPGQLQIIPTASGYRYLRISVRTPGLATERVAWLAHELWHALEIARAPEVRDSEGLQRLYERIGGGGRYTDRLESSAAQETWTRVLRELRDAK